MNAYRNLMKERRDKLGEIARAVDLEIIYAFGSHGEDALKWMKKVQLFMALEALFSVNRVDFVSLPRSMR